MIRSWLWLFSVFFSTYAAALTPVFDISDTDATYVQVPLTHEVYRYSRYSDLHDLLVVDADHKPLPYRIVSAPSVATPEEKVLATALAFYPVMANATPEHMRELRSTHIRVEDARVQVNIDSGIPPEAVMNPAPDFYLIDTGTLATETSALQITWQPGEKNQYIEVVLEASNNLQNWVNLGRSTLVQITQGEQHVIRNQVPAHITAKSYEFLRLKVIQGAESLKITDISALNISHAARPGPQMESWRLDGVVADIQTTVYFPSTHSKTHPVFAWEYVREENTPVDQLSLDFPDAHANALNIFSRNSEGQDWQLRYQGIWFHLKVGDHWQQSDPIALGGNSDKFWRVELNETTRGSLKPALVFAWQPRQLQIITNHQAPYAVVFSPENTSGQNNRLVEQLLGDKQPDWVQATLVSLNVNPLAANATDTNVWKKYVFWIFLTAALVALLVCAFRLFKQVAQSTGSG